jgi:hypothetical protein
MLVIHDEDLARQLEEIAAREHRPVEDVLKSLLARYTPSPSDVEEQVKRVRRSAYAEARRYWQDVGDTERLALSDEELDEQFWLFDGEGIPRLKSEQDKVQLPEGSLHVLAEKAAHAGIRFNETSDIPDYDEILNTEFADHLWRRMQGNNGDIDSG